MANRHRNFDELVAKNFESKSFAKAYITTLINDEGKNLEDALRETIISMGLSNFANKANLSIQHISDFVNKRKKLSTKSLDKYLQIVFGLRIKITVEDLKPKSA